MFTFIEGTQHGYAYGIKSDNGKLLIESYVHWDKGRKLGDVYDEAARKLEALDAALAVHAKGGAA